MKLGTALALLVASTAAYADDRPWHGSVSAGGALLLTGDDNERARGELEFDLEPSRYGAAIAWRQFNSSHRGIITGALVFEAAAARPRVLIDLHADAGVDLDQRAPVIGGGMRSLLIVKAPVGIAFDASGYITIAGIETTRLALSVGAAFVTAW